jgi:hypothetical protein
MKEPYGKGESDSILTLKVAIVAARLQSKRRYPNHCGEKNIPEMKKDGRHVVLDFYDLLIEPLMKSILSEVLTPTYSAL